MASVRRYPNVVVRHNVVCQSSRLGTRPLLIVVHSTESANKTGTGDLEAIGNFFDRWATQASSHVCVDADNNSARYAADGAKAWHVAYWNRLALGIEQIGRAAQTKWDVGETHEAGRWISYWSRKWGIPIRKGAVSNGVVTRAGVVSHSDLGTLGGGHHDPGSPYPLDDVLAFAKWNRKRL